MTALKDRPAPTGPVPTPTVPTNRAASETEQCRMLRSDGTRCPNTALPRAADGEPVICHKHAAKVLAFVVKHQQAARMRRSA